MQLNSRPLINVDTLVTHTSTEHSPSSEGCDSSNRRKVRRALALLHLIFLNVHLKSSDSSDSCDSWYTVDTSDGIDICYTSERSDSSDSSDNSECL